MTWEKTMRRSSSFICVAVFCGLLLCGACGKQETHSDAKPELASAVTPAEPGPPAEPEVEGREVVIEDGVGGKVAIRTEGRPPAGHPRDFFPAAPGTRWVYDVELGDDDPLLYEEVSWPVGAPGDGKSMVTAVRGRLEGSLDETRRPMRLELAVAGPAEKQGPLRYPHGVEIAVVRDDAGAFRGCKNAYWAMTESGRFSANLVLMYDRSSSGAPRGGLGWGEWGQADGHSTRLVFFVDEPGISISVSESPDSLLFTGIDRNREGCEETECLRFVRIVKASESEESGEPSYLDNAFREDIWFARGKGLVGLEQTVGGKRTMTWKLASFRPGRE